MLFDLDNHKFFICVEPIDMRCGADRLAQLVITNLEEDPLSKSLFMFSGKRHKSVKFLFWDSNGFWLLQKKLYKGTFAWPKDKNEAKLKTSIDDVKRMLSGEDCWRKIPSLDGIEL